MSNTLYTGHTLDADEIKEMLRYFNPSDFITENAYYDCKNTYITELVRLARIKNPKTKYNLVRSGFYKKLCDQASNFLVGEDVTISGLRDKPVLDLNKFLQPMGIRANKNGRAWIHFYIDQDKLKYKIIKPTEIIGIYDNQYEDKLLYVIRFYKLQDGKTERTRVEVWDNEKVTYYLEDPQTKNYFLDYITTTEPQTPHILQVGLIMGNPTETEQASWGRPPFIELKYNYDRKPVLGDIKDNIDAYDKIVCGFMDNVDDIRDSILLIKDRGSESLSELKEKMEVFRALFVDDTGDAGYLTLEIPVEARDMLKKEFRSNIYEFGNGVDMSSFKTGGNITNVYIQALFQDLDSKCRGFSKHMDDFILEVLEFYNIYYSLIGRPVENLENVKIKYNKTIPANLVEIIDAVNKSKGVISNKTIFESHPLVEDAEQEEERVDNDLMDIQDNFNNSGGGMNDQGNTEDIPNSGEQTNTTKQEGESK
jgi:SPP1 family phage portal protein